MSWAHLAGIAGLIMVVVAGPAGADNREVSGNELIELLSGNSIDGLWGQTSYIQYFAASGRTLYKARGKPGDWGTWRVDDDGHYCSTWRDGEETCYLVLADDGTFFWQTMDGENTYPFDIIEGDITESGEGDAESTAP
jgi:hypothetical protein